ncbi:hypothetical protein ALC60_14535 [Trachymyrmex zeteki]|uniref:Uncharacterized protein n=1 Tax=Mycetomoellerius zeteki TaxID=64791 RepID=A0A151WF21_9HYME|nr:hypothetical protein ALC60_14535 [Trachymyrmex zeteki]
MSVAATTCPSPTYPTSGTNPWCSTTAVRLFCVVLVSSWIILDQPALGLPNPSELTTVEVPWGIVTGASGRVCAAGIISQDKRERLPTGSS